MVRNHLFTAKIWQSPRIREIRHALSLNRLYRSVTARGRRLPDYIIAGAQKSGTTSIWAYLNEHPNVKPALRKEVNFFDANYDRGLDWYRSYFPLSAPDHVYATSFPETLTGESCANYMFHPLAPRRIAETVPRAKIIFLLRNPVDRAFSHYQLKLRRRQESLSFDDAITAEAGRLAGEEEKIISQGNYFSESHDRFSYLARGRYFDQIIRWQALFPPEQLLILESKEFYDHTGDVFRRVLNYLKLPSWQPLQFGNRFPGRYHEKMSDATRRRLVDYFAPHNERLFAHLRMRFDWDR
jgi:hypothetical protein